MKITNLSNISHYKKLGYIFKLNDYLTIPIKHLTHASERRVDVQCDYCNKIFQKSYKEYNRGRTEYTLENDCCGSCQPIKNREGLMEKYGVENCMHLDISKQKMSIIKSGENHHNWHGGISSIAEHLRNIVGDWKMQYLKSKNWKCELSGNDGAIQVHHRFSFNKIVSMALQELGFEPKSLSEYTKEEIDLLENVFYKLHDELSCPVVLHRSIHKLYHSTYGNDNTPEQFEEFKTRYQTGELYG